MSACTTMPHACTGLGLVMVPRPSGQTSCMRCWAASDQAHLHWSFLGFRVQGSPLHPKPQVSSSSLEQGLRCVTAVFLTLDA